MQLSEQQLRFFKTFGYISVPALFDAAEIAWITSEFEVAIQQVGGKDYDGSTRLMIMGPIERTERLCTLMDDPRILGLIGSVVGNDFNYCTGDGNYYTGDTSWHADGSWGELFAVKVAFYLDPVTRDTGCLRVIPGSHRRDTLIRAEGVDPNASLDLFGVEPRDFPGNVALETKPGDVVMFNHDLVHASFGGGSRRRMFTMNCTRQAHTPEDLKLVRQYVSQHSPGAHKMDKGNGMFEPLMVKTAGPQRMEHLQQALSLYEDIFPKPQTDK